MLGSPWVGAPPNHARVEVVADELRALGLEVETRTVTSAAGLLRSMAARRVAPSLVYVAIPGEGSRSRLRFGAIVARRHASALVIEEEEAGQLDRLRSRTIDRVITDRVVSRCRTVAAYAASPVPAALMSDLGLDTTAATDGIGAITLRDLPAVVRVHMEAFPDAAMTHLGSRVVERYYRWQLIGDHPRPLAVGVWQGGALVGFLVGGWRKDAVSGFARRFLPTVVAGAVTHPTGLRRFAAPQVAQVARLMARRGRSDQSVVRAPEAAPESFGVLSIAVRHGAEGRGVGRDLMAACQQAALDAGATDMHLSVDVENTRAVRFYEGLGWSRQVDAAGGWAGKMTKGIGPGPDPSALRRTDDLGLA